MTRLFALAFALLLTLAAAGPARASTVRYDVDESIDLATWKTFAWRQPEATGEASLADARIRRTLAAELVAKGYVEGGDAGSADFQIAYHAGARRRLRIDESRSRFGRDLRVGSSPEGFLVVDFIDRRTGRLAWRGAVSDALASDPDKADRKAAKAVEKLLEKLPSAE